MKTSRAEQAEDAVFVAAVTAVRLARMGDGEGALLELRRMSRDVRRWEAATKRGGVPAPARKRDRRPPPQREVRPEVVPESP